jgi:hypothetical protein
LPAIRSEEVLALIRQIYEYREPSKRIRLAMAARDPRQALGEGDLGAFLVLGPAVCRSD